MRGLKKTYDKLIKNALIYYGGINVLKNIAQMSKNDPYIL
jgi:hypothetical protein